MALDGRRGRTARWRSSARRRCRRSPSSSDSVRSNCAVVRRRSRAASPSAPGSVERRARRRSARRASTWNSGVCARLRAGADHLDDLLERQVLVVLRRDHLRRGSARSSSRTLGAPCEVDAQRQRVDEEADQRLDLGAAAARDRACRSPRRPGRRAGRAAAAQLASTVMNSVTPWRRLSASDPLDQRGGEARPAMPVAGVVLVRGPRAIGRQLEQRSARRAGRPARTRPGACSSPSASQRRCHAA